MWILGISALLLSTLVGTEAVCDDDNYYSDCVDGFCWFLCFGDWVSYTYYNSHGGCEKSVGGTLARVDSKEKQASMEAFMTAAGEATYRYDIFEDGTLIDGSQENYDDGKWRYLDGTEVVYTSWADGQPDDGANYDWEYWVEDENRHEDCTGLFPTDEFKWNDISCSPYLLYLCEVDEEIPGGQEP